MNVLSTYGYRNADVIAHSQACGSQFMCVWMFCCFWFVTIFDSIQICRLVRLLQGSAVIMSQISLWKVVGVELMLLRTATRRLRLTSGTCMPPSHDSTAMTTTTLTIRVRTNRVHVLKEQPTWTRWDPLSLDLRCRTGPTDCCHTLEVFAAAAILTARYQCCFRRGSSRGPMYLKGSRVCAAVLAATKKPVSAHPACQTAWLARSVRKECFEMRTCISIVLLPYYVDLRSF